VEDLARREVLVGRRAIDSPRRREPAAEADAARGRRRAARAGRRRGRRTCRRCADDQVDRDRELARLADELGVALELVERRRRVAGDEEVAERDRRSSTSTVMLALRGRRALAQPRQQRAGRARERARALGARSASGRRMPTTSMLMRTSIVNSIDHFAASLPVESTSGGETVLSVPL
jgi:hypothetical protein